MSTPIVSAPPNQSSTYLELVDLFLTIRRKSIFSLLTQDRSKSLLEKHTTLDTFGPGQVVTRRPQPAELLIVAQGSVGLFTTGKSPEKVGEATAGRSLELETLFKQAKRWTHDWVAQTSCQILRIDWSAMLAVLDQDPLLLGYLEKVTVHPELQRLKNDLKLFGFEFRETMQLFQKLERVALKDPTTLDVGVLLVICKGELTVRGRVRGQRRTLGHLIVGDHLYYKAREPALELEASADAEAWVATESSLTGLIRAEPLAKFLKMSDSVATKIAALNQPVPVRVEVEPSGETEAESEEDDGLKIGDFQASGEGKTRRFPWQKAAVVRQHDQMDCGAACLATVAKHYGRNISLPVFRSLVHVTRDGASLLGLKKAADRVGFLSMGIMSSVKSLKNLQLPAIVLLQYHFVVVNRISDTHVNVSDPGRGEVDVEIEQFAREYSKNALVLKPTPEFFRFPEAQASVRKYLELFRGNGLDFARIAALTLIMFALGLVTPIVTQVATDTVLVGNRTDLALALVVFMLAMNVTNSVSSWVRGYLLTQFTAAVDGKFSCLFLKHVYGLPLNYFAVRRVGDFTSRMGELGKIRSFFSSKPISIFLSILSIIIYGCVLGLYSTTLLGLTVAMVPVMAGMILFTTPKLTSITSEMYKAGSKSSSVIFEHFRNIETLRVLRGFIAARWRWESMFLHSTALSRRYQRLNGALGGISGLMQTSFNTVMFLVAVRSFMTHELTLGQVMAISTLSGQVLGAAMSLITEWHSLNEFRLSVGRVDDVITAAVETSGDDAERVQLQVRGDVELRNVEFRYGSEMSPIILQNISLKIKAGETVAFVGRSGSGKTTLGYMINVLYAPTKGQILIDGVPTDKIALTSLRRQVAMIMQENGLFSGTILDNVTLGDANPSFHRAVEAAKAADAHGFVSNMKFGYATRLGEGGAGLSGGQKQRLNIARALYVDPAILIMDEATSALDSVSEKAIVTNVKARHSSRTTIIIAHRLNTIMHADRIILLDKGRIIESGSHAELINLQGSYFDLFRMQMGT